MQHGFHKPSHAYVPGKNKRHDEGCFTQIKTSVRQGMSVEELYASSAFSHGWHYLEQGFYWEAHEVLEPVWMALPKDSSDRKFVQGLIQLANGKLKLEMGMAKAAMRLAEISRGLVEVPGIHLPGKIQTRCLQKIAQLEQKAKNAL